MLPNTKLKPNAKLYGKDEIEIKPLGPPVGHLFYVDYLYETLLEVRMKKIKKIKENINNDET